jgi:hypothetical protein
LLQVAQATGFARVFTRSGKDGEQNCREYRYNRYDNKQFYEGKTFVHPFCRKTLCPAQSVSHKLLLEFGSTVGNNSGLNKRL